MDNLSENFVILFRCFDLIFYPQALPLFFRKKSYLLKIYRISSGENYTSAELHYYRCFREGVSKFFQPVQASGSLSQLLSLAIVAQQKPQKIHKRISVSVQIKLALWALKFECHILDLSQNIIVLFFSTYLNVTTVFNWAVQKQDMSQTWSVECSLRIPVSEEASISQSKEEIWTLKSRQMSLNSIFAR